MTSTTPLKSGSIWLTSICHQIRMGGEFAGIFPDYDPNTMKQPPGPRVFLPHVS